MTTWKYFIEKTTLEKLEHDLSELGSGGWELVSAAFLPGPGAKILLILKQPSSKT